MHGADVIPASFCDLAVTGKLFNLWTDCSRLHDPVLCECCTVCCDSLDSCIPKEEMGGTKIYIESPIASNHGTEGLGDDDYYDKLKGVETDRGGLHRIKRRHQQKEQSY